MSLASVRAFLAAHAPDLHVVELETSTAPVALRVGERVVLVVTRGDARLDNRKAKAALGGKPKMLEADEVEAITGHPVGGVCPFGLASALQVYCDVSLQDFDEVVPAAGSINAAVRISPGRMAELTGAAWVDLCQDPPIAGTAEAAPS
jgi:prolyl-tRNA editing enzyme YbaK/EbsC (Cys-tRNA(Pro) deacylase)